MSSALDATDLRHLGIGCWVWSKTRGREGVDDAGNQVAPVGGVVVDLIERMDDETGVIERTYVAADVVRGRFTLRRLDAADVDQATMAAAGPSEIARVWRQLHQEIALGPNRKLRTGLALPEHLTLDTYAHRLAGLLA